MGQPSARLVGGSLLAGAGVVAATTLASRIVGESLHDETRQRGIVDRFLAELEAGTIQPSKLGAGRGHEQGR